MTDDLVKRLRWKAGAYAKEAADRIEALTEQLKAARRDAKEAEAYAEDLEKERDRNGEEILHLRFLVELAVEALQAFKDFDALPLQMKRIDVFEQKVRRKQFRTLETLKGEANE